jgi:hypothetical protein
MRRFTELLGFYALGGFAGFADAGFLWGSSWRFVNQQRWLLALLESASYLSGCAPVV